MLLFCTFCCIFKGVKNILQTFWNHLALGEEHLFWPQLPKQLQSLNELVANIKVFGLFCLFVCFSLSLSSNEKQIFGT